jgi:hypothetical protein
VATKTFTVFTSPHIADLGVAKLQFAPEVAGAEFAEAFLPLQAARAAIKAKGDNEVSADDLRASYDAMSGFLVRFLLPESVPEFTELGLPERVLGQLIEWLSSVYAGGDGSEDGGEGNDQSGPSTV